MLNVEPAQTPSMARPKPRPPSREGAKGAYSYALELQAVAVRDCLDPETTPAAKAQLMRAWDALEERKAILKGRGKPANVPAANDPRSKLAKRQPAPEPSESKPG